MSRCSFCGSINHTRSQCTEDPPDEFGRPRAVEPDRHLHAKRSVRLSDEAWEQFGALCHEAGRSRNEVVTELVTAWCESRRECSGLEQSGEK